MGEKGYPTVFTNLRKDIARNVNPKKGNFNINGYRRV